MFKHALRFVKIIDAQTVIVTGLALLSTWLCRRFDFHADMPTGLIGAAIVFPIVFSINASYKRREQALGAFGNMKSRLMALYFAHRDWGVSDGKEDSERGKQIVLDFLKAISNYFKAEGEDANLRLEVQMVYSRMSSSIEILRGHGVSPTEISRCNQYLGQVLDDFETMRNIKHYRTPKSLRSYSWVFLNAFPILYGPYFAYLDMGYEAFGYVVACLYALVLVSLDNIQEDLENPFDGVGEDDLRLDVVQHYDKLMCGECNQRSVTD